MNFEKNSESVIVHDTDLLSNKIRDAHNENQSNAVNQLDCTTDILNDLESIRKSIHISELETFQRKNLEVLNDKKCINKQCDEPNNNSTFAKDTKRDISAECVGSKDKDVDSDDTRGNNQEHFLDDEIKKKLCDNSDEAIPLLSCSDPHTDAKRTRRVSKRKRDGEECCPVCGVTIRLTDMESHYAKEVENLSKITRNLRKHSLGNKDISTTFVQVKSNRENRLSAKVSRYTAKDKNAVYCPVCKLRLGSNQSDINKHVLDCIIDDDNSEVDVVVDDDDVYEEYEFGGETRVRAISFVPGGYRSLEGSTSIITSAEDDEEVDVDNTLTFGEPQYSELDIIHNAEENAGSEVLELRRAVLLDPNVQPHLIESRKWSHKVEKSDYSEQSSSSNQMNIEAEKESNSTENDINWKSNLITSLKERIKDLEEQNRSVKCLICLESYAKPVVSTTCWHVHCEECWLMTMGVKKLCPQCNMIVFPSDLRRIYL